MERLLISTFNQLILWDGKQNVVREGHSFGKAHKYYGITWNAFRIYVIEGGRGRTPTRCLIFNERLRYQGILPIGEDIFDPHQCYWWDDALYICNTGRNRIDVWDGKNLRRISGIWSHKTHEHINSIWCDGQKFFVVEHRKHSTPKRIRIFDSDFDALLDTVELYQGKTEMRGIHNVYVEKGMMYLCGLGKLIRVHLEDGKIETFCPSPWAQKSNYLRGFARTPDHFFVGVSEAAVRDERIKGDSAVLVLDNDLKLVDTILLKGTGNLTEIRAVDGPDLAHNRIACPYV